MKEITLTQGKTALVDDADYDFLMQWRWTAILGYKDNFYAKRYGQNDKMIFMHRVLTNCPPEMYVDHIDRNGLNNQRANLRICTPFQNQGNTVLTKAGKIRGVQRSGKGWSARCGKKKYLGQFATEIEAARAYDKSAKEQFGEFARLNFPEAGRTPESAG